MKHISLVISLLFIISCSTDSEPEITLEGNWKIESVETTDQNINERYPNFSEEKSLLDTITFSPEDGSYQVKMSACGSYNLKYSIDNNKIIFNTANTAVGSLFDCYSSPDGIISIQNTRIWFVFIRIPEFPSDSGFTWPKETTSFELNKNDLKIVSVAGNSDVWTFNLKRF